MIRPRLTPSCRPTGTPAGIGPRRDRKEEKLGEVALVMRVPKEAFDYITNAAGDRPRTAFVRDVLAKGDAALAKMLGA